MVLINDVYNTILTLANKESNSFVAPEEFNDIAKKAQSEIFESYFYEKQNYAIASGGIPDADYSDVDQNVREKISLFEDQVTLTISTDNADFEVDQSNFYRFSKLFLPNYDREIEEASFSEISSLINSPYYCPTELKPIYVKVGGTSDNPFALRVFPRAQFNEAVTPNTLTSGIDTVLLHYVRSPRTPNWVGSASTGQLIPETVNANYQDFELHASEFHNLVNKIAKSVGIITRDVNLINYFSGEDQIVEQKEQ